MAIGYSTIISKCNEHYFEHWLSFIDKEFILFNEGKIHVLNEEGDENIVSLEDVKRGYSVNIVTIMKFRNRWDHWISCTLKCIDNYLAIEEYSLDELLTEQEDEELYNILLKRSSELVISKKVIGFIFDSEGYMEDYIRISKPVE